MKTIGIIGSRRRNDFADYDVVERAFIQIVKRFDILVSGGCPKGGDRFAEVIAYATGRKIIIHYPKQKDLDPELLKKNPRAAYAKINYARNALIARDADVLIAVVAPNRKGGTEDTIRRFCRKHRKSEAQLIKEKKLILV